MNYIRCEAFLGGAVGGGDTLSFVGGKAWIMKAVEDVEGGLADPATSNPTLPQLEFLHTSSSKRPCSGKIKLVDLTGRQGVGNRRGSGRQAEAVEDFLDGIKG